MKILVANLGSTSFKYRLFEMDAEGERAVAKGGYERVEDFGAVIGDALGQLVGDGHLESVDALDAVGFKPVPGKDLSEFVVTGSTGPATSVSPSAAPSSSDGRMWASACAGSMSMVRATSPAGHPCAWFPATWAAAAR